MEGFLERFRRLLNGLGGLDVRERLGFLAGSLLLLLLCITAVVVTTSVTIIPAKPLFRHEVSGP